MPTNIVVIGMGYVGIPMAALLADVDDFYVTGIQRRSQRSGWKIDWLNSGKNPFEGVVWLQNLSCKNFITTRGC